MNIYLDIDGVLITNGGQPSPHIYEFLKYVTTEYNCIWLTTHCRDGNVENPYNYLSDVLPDCKEFLKKIKPTTWDILKTEGIDFDQDFIWLDDYLMQSEEKILEEKKVIHNFYKINLKENPRQLMEVLESLID